MPQESNRAEDITFEEMVAERLELARRELAEIDGQLDELQQARTVTRARVQHLSALIELDAGARTSSSTETVVPETRTSETTKPLVADADAVLALLTERRQELHYRQIHDELVKLGYEIGGQDPPNTLLARFFNDDRLVRTKRGTYAVRPSTRQEAPNE